ncbi:hypothetical protein V8C86DRAFT_2916306, partial [Haematococcus lacustris]
MSLFTALGFMVQFKRDAVGSGLTKLQLLSCTLFLPSDELSWWMWISQSTWPYNWWIPINAFKTTLSTSLLVHELSPARATLKWTDVQLVSVVTQLPSAPILVQETGLMRLNGLGTSPFQLRLFLQTLTSLSILRLAPDPQLAWRVAQLTSSVRAALPEVMTCTDLTLHQRTVIIGHPAWPQALLLDLAGAPSCLAQQGPDAQLTLSSLVLANAAPLLSSLVCGSAARQAGILCTPPAGPAAARNLSSPDASSRAVWQAVGLPPLDSVSPLLPLCTPALADALGGFTSLLWFFASSRTHPTEQPPLARAPLVLLNVTLLLPDLEMRAIRELAQGGSTRVNLRPDTLDLLQAQLADQQVFPAAWPPGGLTFPSLSW